MLTSAKNDTLSARYQMLGARKNLPYCMDELTTMKDTELSNMLFDIANGMEKHKSKIGGAELVNTGHWATTTFLTSNRSIYEMMRGLSMQTTAESMRVVEIPCRFRNYSGTRDGAAIERVLRLMESNYGLAGPAFMNALFTTRPESFSEVGDMAADWDGRMRKSPEERFWTYGLGLVLAVGRLARETGFLNYDMDALEEWVTGELFPRLRMGVRSSVLDGQAIMTMFLNENLDSTLVVASRERKGKHSPEMDHAGDGWIVHEPTRELHIRLELDTRTFAVQARYLENWCLEHRLSAATVLEELAAGGKRPDPEKRLVVLGRGVSRLSSGQLACYIFRDLEVPDAFATFDS
jgi:hypothetical protein